MADLSKARPPPRPANSLSKSVGPGVMAANRLPAVDEAAPPFPHSRPLPPSRSQSRTDDHQQAKRVPTPTASTTEAGPARSAHTHPVSSAHTRPTLPHSSASAPSSARSNGANKPERGPRSAFKPAAPSLHKAGRAVQVHQPQQAPVNNVAHPVAQVQPQSTTQTSSRPTSAQSSRREPAAAPKAQPIPTAKQHAAPGASRTAAKNKAPSGGAFKPTRHAGAPIKKVEVASKSRQRQQQPAQPQHAAGRTKTDTAVLQRAITPPPPQPHHLVEAQRPHSPEPAIEQPLPPSPASTVHESLPPSPRAVSRAEDVQDGQDDDIDETAEEEESDVESAMTPPVHEPEHPSTPAIVAAPSSVEPALTPSVHGLGHPSTPAAAASSAIEQAPIHSVPEPEYASTTVATAPLSPVPTPPRVTEFPAPASLPPLPPSPLPGAFTAPVAPPWTPQDRTVRIRVHLPPHLVRLPSSTSSSPSSWAASSGEDSMELDVVEVTEEEEAESEEDSSPEPSPARFQDEVVLVKSPALKTPVASRRSPLTELSANYSA
jgi:hypothetical protein